MSEQSPRRIQPLPKLLANQIAAGEVVERPASVVKELLENSLDAGARSLEIELRQGGSQLIRIRDDGCGIDAEDMPLAVAPHATSKVYSLDELEGIATLGFRGEALASISSVSRFSLHSCRSGEESGWGLRINEGEGNPVVEPVPHPPGTTVEVRDLFYNTPARRKFLRTERTEFLHVEEVVKRIALARYDVALRFNHNGRRVLQVAPADSDKTRTRRIAAVLGNSFTARATPFDNSAAGMRLWGWLDDPGSGRAQGDIQYFFLNGRAVKDRLLNHAVRRALEPVLPQGRHPGYVLYLELDPRQVDVNVHPTKHEVRFRETRMVHDFIVSTLQRAAGGEVSADSKADQREPYQPQPLQQQAVGESGSEVAVSRQSRARGSSHGIGVADAYRQLYRTPPAVSPLKGGESLPESLQLSESLLLLKRGEELQLVELERLDNALARRRLQSVSESTPMTGQPLLVPVTICANAQQLQWLESMQEALQCYGLELRPLSSDTVALRQIPDLLRNADHQALLNRLLACADSGERVDAVIASYSRRYAGTKVERAALGALLVDLEQIDGEGVTRTLTPQQFATMVWQEGDR